MMNPWRWQPTAWPRCGGGQVVVKNGKVIGQVELKIAGLMSNERADVVAKKAETILKGFPVLWL